MRKVNSQLVFLSVPGLREQDLDRMPALRRTVSDGSMARIAHSFPCVTWPSQANMLTGARADQHGVIANGFFWRDSGKLEMWTAGNEVIQKPQIWDVLKEHSPPFTSAAWFPMLSKGCGADVVCMPAPIHKPDGSEELWCYTKPQSFYGELLERLGHFPLQHFWGPLANIRSSQWIADSAAIAAEKFQPDFFYVYLPHLDYAAQRNGPDSPQALEAVSELDSLIAKFVAAMNNSNHKHLEWMIASEYVITPVDHVLYPNRLLRDYGLLRTIATDHGDLIDFANSEAWSLVDHQFSHVFLKDSTPAAVDAVAALFEKQPGVAEVLSGTARKKYHLVHPRSGEIIVISQPNSWQAYYWWFDASQAPDFARTVDIHRKPGYDPIELHFDFATKTVPLDCTLARGSHGAPATSDSQRGVFVCSSPLSLPATLQDIDLFHLVLAKLLAAKV